MTSIRGTSDTCPHGEAPQRGRGGNVREAGRGSYLESSRANLDGLHFRVAVALSGAWSRLRYWLVS